MRISQFAGALGWRDAAAEADNLLGQGEVGLVLEPSPTLEEDPDWLADDPVSRRVPEGAPAVSPGGLAGRSWTERVADNPDLEAFAADRWLGSYRPLTPLPDDFAASRLALHRVASQVVSPARRQAIAKMGLRYTYGGFGTPFFSSDGAAKQVRVVATGTGAAVVVQEGGTAVAAPIESLQQVGDVVGTPPDTEWAAGLDIPEPGTLDAPLEVDPAAALGLAEWFGFAWSILEELRAEDASSEASRPQLWPEHFDPAIEIGSAAAEQRAIYGFSPGDVTKSGAAGNVSGPYVYVGPWFPDARPDSDFWNAKGFPGAMVSYGEVLAASDDGAAQREFVLAFLRKGRDLLVGQR